jgi:hypothetical protein
MLNIRNKCSMEKNEVEERETAKNKVNLSLSEGLICYTKIYGINREKIRKISSKKQLMSVEKEEKKRSELSTKYT